MTWEEHRAAWRGIPIDDHGYYDAAEILNGWSDYALRQNIGEMEHVRYRGWRNQGGLWRTGMGLDSVHGKRVLDYGCGIGLEALQYAKAGNVVSIADINEASVMLAERVMRLYGYAPAYAFVIDERPPFIGAYEDDFDVVVMNGVLHHIEDPQPVVREAHRWLTDGGELRLMVYTDMAWRTATGELEPPADVHGHPMESRWRQFFCEEGSWIDWYDRVRLEERFGQWFAVRDFTYITPDSRYATAQLEKI